MARRSDASTSRSAVLLEGCAACFASGCARRLADVARMTEGDERGLLDRSLLALRSLRTFQATRSCSATGIGVPPKRHRCGPRKVRRRLSYSKGILGSLSFRRKPI